MAGGGRCDGCLPDPGFVDRAGVDELDLKGAGARPLEVVEALLPASGRDDELLGGAATLVADAARDLEPSHARLVLRAFGHFVHFSVGALALDELVDHLRRRMPRTGHDPRSDAVRIYRRGAEGGDGVFVEVARDGDLRRCRAEVVELLAHGERLGDEVARIEPDRAQLAAGLACGGDGVVHALGDVVGVHQQSGPRAHRRDLGGERLLLRIVDEGEGMRGRPGDAEVIGAPAFQVRRRRETRDDGGARGVDGRGLVRAARAEFQAGAAVGGGRHARGGRGHRRIVVEDREDDRLQHDAFGE